MYLSDLPGKYNIDDDQASIHTGIPEEQLSQIGCGSRQTWVEINSRSPVSKVLLHHRQVHIAPLINGRALMYLESMCGDGTLELLMLSRLFLVVPIPQLWADARVVRTVCIDRRSCACG